MKLIMYHTFFRFLGVIKTTLNLKKFLQKKIFKIKINFKVRHIFLVLMKLAQELSRLLYVDDDFSLYYLNSYKYKYSNHVVDKSNNIMKKYNRRE